MRWTKVRGKRSSAAFTRCPCPRWASSWATSPCQPLKASFGKLPAVTMFWAQIKEAPTTCRKWREQHNLQQSPTVAIASSAFSDVMIADPRPPTAGLPSDGVGELGAGVRTVPELLAWSSRARTLISALQDGSIDADIVRGFGPGASLSAASKGLHVPFDNAVLDPHQRWRQRVLRDEATSAPEVLVSPEDVIITVALCDCSGRKEQEYDVLASQTLHDLRDALYFVDDWMYDGPTRLNSACMFIDGVFYSDMRHATSVDYSKDLIEWIKVTGRPQLREERSRSMGTRLCDLERIPFGERCCYIRQGDIEHHMYFISSRLLNESFDCPIRGTYPCLLWMRRHRKRACMACCKALAAWVVLDCTRCPFNPAYFCRFCFAMLTQDEEGRELAVLSLEASSFLLPSHPALKVNISLATYTGIPLQNQELKVELKRRKSPVPGPPMPLFDDAVTSQSSEQAEEVATLKRTTNSEGAWSEELRFGEAADGGVAWVPQLGDKVDVK
ncbi:unnamed protein product, partial [Effrenium voratum]